MIQRFIRRSQRALFEQVSTRPMMDSFWHLTGRQEGACENFYPNTGFVAFTK